MIPRPQTVYSATSSTRSTGPHRDAPQQAHRRQHAERGHQHRDQGDDAARDARARTHGGDRRPGGRCLGSQCSPSSVGVGGVGGTTAGPPHPSTCPDRIRMRCPFDPHPSPGWLPMRIAVIGAGIAGPRRGPRPARARTTSRCSSATAARAVTPTPSRSRGRGRGDLHLDTGLPGPQPLQLPAADPTLPRAGRARAGLGHVVLGQLRGAPAWSTRRCACGRSRGRWRIRSFPGLLREIVRFLRTAGDALEERFARTTLGEYVARQGYSRAFRDLYLVPFTVGPVVDRARRRRWPSPCPTRCASSRTTACWASAATAG